MISKQAKEIKENDTIILMYDEMKVKRIITVLDCVHINAILVTLNKECNITVDIDFIFYLNE